MRPQSSRPELSRYRHVAAGKVREIYAVDDDHLLLVATDRLSAYDWVLSTPVPDKGRILTAMSVFFFEQLTERLGIANHLAGDERDPRIPAEVLGRALIVTRLDMVPVECVARGYLTGSGLIEYQQSGAVCGIELPAGLREASKLAPPIFTPATKAELGEHDENVDLATVAARHGVDLANQLRDRTLDIYSCAADIAAEKGFILADTKLEFGHNSAGELILADEVLTPDSSRYWARETYQEGCVQPSFDKQMIRNWLTSAESGWDRTSQNPPPALPVAVVDDTRSRYIEAYERISGKSFADWPDSASA